MKTYISKEDAEKIAESVISNYNGASFDISYDPCAIYPDDLAAIINLAIANVIGEPVGFAFPNSAEIELTEHSVGMLPLYAIKELPND